MWRSPRLLQQDVGGGFVVAAATDQLHRPVQISVARGQTLGKAERVAGFDQHVQAPVLDLLADSRFMNFGGRHLHISFLCLFDIDPVLEIHSTPTIARVVPWGSGKNEFLLPITSDNY
jgi:hypothetical protein